MQRSMSAAALHGELSKFDAAELRAALHCTLRILRLAKSRG